MQTQKETMAFYQISNAKAVFILGACDKTAKPQWIIHVLGNTTDS